MDFSARIYDVAMHIKMKCIFYILKLCVLITYMLLRFLKFLSVRCIYVKAFICFLFICFLFNLYKLLFGMQSFTSIRFCNFSKFLTKYRSTAVGHGGSIGSNLLLSKVFFLWSSECRIVRWKKYTKEFYLVKMNLQFKSYWVT